MDILALPAWCARARNPCSRRQTPITSETISTTGDSTEFPRPARIATVAPLCHFDPHEAVMRERGADPQFVPRVEPDRRRRVARLHQSPRPLAHGRPPAVGLQFRIVALPAG